MTAKSGGIDTGSVFASPGALLALALATGLSLSFNALPFASFAAAVLVLLGATRLWALIALSRLDAELSLGATRLFPGESLELRAELRNRKILPVGLRIELEAGPGLLPAGSGAFAAETELAPFGRASGSWTFIATSRGVHRLGPARLVAGDLLGLCSRSRGLPFAGEIVVFPARRALGEIDPPFRDYFGIRPSKGIIEDPAWYEGTREYTGDKPARSIHWKASARLGTLQEKIFQPSTHRKIFFILDGGGFEDLDDRSGFETALEIIASLATSFSEHGA